MRDFEAAGLGEEGREILGAVTNDRDSCGFEHLERAANVEDGFGTGAYDGDTRARQLGEVGGHIHGRFTAAMNTSNTARDEDIDPSGATCDAARRE